MRRLTQVILLSVCLSTAAACGGSDKKAKADETAKPTKAPVKDFEGELTADLLRKANRGIEVYNTDTTPADFSAAMAQARQFIGKPTRTDGDQHAWGLVDGHKCSFYVLINDGGKAKSPGFMTVDKAAGPKHAQCLAALGKK